MNVELTGSCTVCGSESTFLVLDPDEAYEVCDHHAQGIIDGHDVTLEG